MTLQPLLRVGAAGQQPFEAWVAFERRERGVDPGLLKGASGSYQSGLLLLGVASLAGAGLALWLRRAPVLAGVGPRMETAAQRAS